MGSCGTRFVGAPADPPRRGFRPRRDVRERGRASISRREGSCWKGRLALARLAGAPGGSGRRFGDLQQGACGPLPLVARRFARAPGGTCGRAQRHGAGRCGDLREACEFGGGTCGTRFVGAPAAPPPERPSAAAGRARAKAGIDLSARGVMLEGPLGAGSPGGRAWRQWQALRRPATAGEGAALRARPWRNLRARLVRARLVRARRSHAGLFFVGDEGARGGRSDRWAGRRMGCRPQGRFGGPAAARPLVGAGPPGPRGGER